MMHVNLLRPAGPGDLRGRMASRRAVWLALATLIVAVAATTMGWWSARRETRQIDQQIVLAETELEGLRAAARETTALLARRTELARHLAAAEREAAARSAPVRLLAAVGESVPDGLWFTELRQKGPQLEIDGRAHSLSVVTDFAERIHVAGVLTTPVEIVSTSAETRDGVTLVRFSLRLD